MINKHLMLAIGIILLFFPKNYILAQTNAQTLGDKLCACLETNKVKPDSIRVKECRQSIHENLAAMTKNAREKTLEEMGIYLKKNCKEYLQVMTSSKNTNKGDWETLNTNPISSLTKSECRSILDHTNMYYIEGNGDTTHVQIVDGYWKELSGPAKYSTVDKFTWSNDCDFELEFLQSNNPIENKFFKKGEIHRYRVIAMANGYYNLTATSQGIILKFKLYY